MSTDRNCKAELDRDLSFLNELAEDLEVGRNGDPVRLDGIAEKLEHWKDELEARAKMSSEKGSIPSAGNEKTIIQPHPTATATMPALLISNYKVVPIEPCEVQMEEAEGESDWPHDIYTSMVKDCPDTGMLPVPKVVIERIVDQWNPNGRMDGISYLRGLLKASQ